MKWNEVNACNTSLQRHEFSRFFDIFPSNKCRNQQNTDTAVGQLHKFCRWISPTRALFVAFLPPLLIRSCNAVRLAINQNASIHVALIHFQAFVIYSLTQSTRQNKKFQPMNRVNWLRKSNFVTMTTVDYQVQRKKKEKGKEWRVSFLLLLLKSLCKWRSTRHRFSELELCEVFSSSFRGKLPTSFDAT